MRNYVMLDAGSIIDGLLLDVSRLPAVLRCHVDVVLRLRLQLIVNPLERPLHCWWVKGNVVSWVSGEHHGFDN